MHPCARLLGTLIGTTACSVAMAHHPTDGAMPTTAVDGLLSGLAHPVIEFDHLLFMLAAAVLAGLSRMGAGRLVLALAAFALAGMLGTSLRVPGVELPLLEPMLGGTLLIVAYLLWRGRVPGFGKALLMAAGAGFLHGQAYGEAVIGAEATPVVWYLAGLLLVQCALLVGVALLVRRTAPPAGPHLAKTARWLGAVASAAGLWLVGAAVFS